MISDIELMDKCGLTAERAPVLPLELIGSCAEQLDSNMQKRVYSVVLVQRGFLLYMRTLTDRPGSI